MTERLRRREMMARAGLCLGTAAVAASAPSAVGAAGEARQGEPFLYCLNTATLMGCKLPIDREVQIAAEAGYGAVEPWLRGIEALVTGGGSLEDLRKRIADSGLTVAGAIGFTPWAIDDDAKRAEGLETMRRDMDRVAKIGGRSIAAPPAGINRLEGVDLRKVAQRYRALLEVGRQAGVVPQLEIWGSAKTLGTAAEAVFVAAAADHPDACVLLDAFHLYKGGSGFHALKLLNGAAMHCFHMNDYPADPPRETATDADRIFPGDGVAPLGQIIRDLHATGFRGALSLELFNRTYWEQDPLTVAKTGLEKMKNVVRKALAGG